MSQHYGKGPQPGRTLAQPPGVSHRGLTPGKDAPWPPIAGAARLADLEVGLTDKEAKLAERERTLQVQERSHRAYQGGLVEREQSIRRRVGALNRRAGAAGPAGAHLLQHTDVQAHPSVFEPEEIEEQDLELAVRQRKEALARREEALIARVEATAARERALRVRKQRLHHLQEVLDTREHLLNYVSRQLDEALGLTPVSSPPAISAARAGSPTGSGERTGSPDAKIDQMLHGKQPVDTSVPPAEPEAQVPRAPRIGLRVYVGFNSEHNFYAGFTQNISAGGLFIATHQPLDVGRQVELLFHVPTKKGPLRTRGEVAWVREYSDATSDVSPGMGIRFVDLSEEDTEAIRGFLKNREPLFVDMD